MTADPTPDDAPLSPQRMLALAEQQQLQVAARTAALVPWILLAWGTAWLVGFVVLWADARQHPDSALPSFAAGVTLGALLVVAGVVSAVLGARSSRGLRGTRQSAFIGIVYGNTWWLGGIAIVVIGQALHAKGAPVSLLTVFYPSAFILFAGVMHLAAGLIWRARPLLVLGVWSIALSAVGAVLPHPTAYLVYGIAGGGALLLAAPWAAWWRRGAGRRLAAGDDRG